MKKATSKKKRGTDLDSSRRVFEGIGDGGKWWKPKVGENRIRILPSNREDGAIAVKSILHYGFKIGGENRAFPCMSTLKQPCPVCKLISRLDTDNDPDTKDLLKSISPRQSFLMNILDQKADDGVIKIYSAGVQVAREVYALLNDEDYGDITDPTTGRDLKITRTGEGFTTKYSVRAAPKESEVEFNEDELHNLESERYREIPSYKKYIKYMIEAFGDQVDIKGILLGEDEEDEDLDEDDEEDVDLEENEEDDEEDKPVRTKPRKQGKKVIKKSAKKKTSRDLEGL